MHTIDIKFSKMMNIQNDKKTFLW